MKTPLSKKNSQELDWLQNIQNYYWLQDVLQIYVGLAAWVIQWDGGDKLDWMELTPQLSGHLRPTHFEISYEKEAERDAYYLRSLKRAAKDNKIQVDHFGGFYDLFLPLHSLGKGMAFLYTGFFLKSPADWSSLAGQWRKFTGKEPTGADPDFLSYVRMVLKLPVLDETLLKGVKDFLGCYADFLMGNPKSIPLHEQVNELRRTVFANRLPNSSWAQEALGLEKLVPPPWAWYQDKQLAPWMKEELGISHIPTTVFAVMPLQQGLEGTDAVKTLIRNYQIQLECLSFVKKVPETVAEKLQDYGMIFLTAPDPDKNEVQARLQIRERAEMVQDFVKKRFGLKSAAGIGRPVPHGDVLYTSYQEAVLALHLCVQTEKPLLFFGENPQAGSGPGYARLHRGAMDLLGAFEGASLEGIKLASDRYVREVLEFAGGNAEVVRGQFLALLFNFLEKVRKHSVLNPQDEKNYADNFCKKLGNADSVYRLIGVFKETLQGLSALAAHPLEGSKEIRMEATLSFLKENFHQTLRLPKIAKEAGFSVPVFCRVFKQTTGMSFVAYLNKLRVEQAKTLLKTSNLNIFQIGHSCGFQTPHHFIRNFKQWTGVTPGDYRKKKPVSK